MARDARVVLRGLGRNLKLAKHLMKVGASPQYSLYAAAYNRDTDAIRLLVR